MEIILAALSGAVQKAVEKEKQIGHTVFKGISLTELADIWQHNKEFDESQIDMFESIPCTCAL